jgi:hypothetical protein
VKRVATIFPILMWGCFVAWLLLLFLIFLRIADQGQNPIDFLAYHRAADAVQQGHSPYLSLEASRQIWQAFHRQETALLQASTDAARQHELRTIAARPQQPGPYLYPPTLALLIAQLHINALIFAGLSLLTIFGFAWLWLYTTSRHPAWLLLIIGSFDVLASLTGGNVELLLLFVALLACWLLWRNHPLIAAPLIGFVLLVKPFYAILFLAFGLLQIASHPATMGATLKSLALALAATLLILMLEVYRWGSALQSAAVQYMQHALDYQWFVLPAAEQTPMSAWNRTPLQALISAGLPVVAAEALTIALWLLFLGITVWVVRRRELSFSLIWACAFLLLYWGRPVGWGLIYLELVLVSSAWPSLPRWGRLLLLALVVALMASHWWALVLTARGEGMPLLTLQRADLPWETWLVLPLSWLLVLRVAVWASTHAPTSPPAASAPAYRRAQGM